MKSLWIIAASLSLFAQEGSAPPQKHAPNDQTALSIYWKLIAAHHAQTSLALQHEAAAKQARESIVQIDKELDEQKKKLCSAEENLDETGADPICAPKSEAKATK